MKICTKEIWRIGKMSCYWYEAKGGMFGTCEECAPDSAHDCPSDGDVRGCDLYSPFGGRPAHERENKNE